MILLSMFLATALIAEVPLEEPLVEVEMNFEGDEVALLEEGESVYEIIFEEDNQSEAQE